MPATSTRPPMSAMLAALLLADILASKPGTAAGPDGLPPGLKELLSAKCDDPTCEACHPDTAANKQQGANEAAEETAPVRVSEYIEIPHDVAEMVGMTKPDFDPESLVGHTSLLTAAFIVNARKLGEQPMDAFPKAGATLSGIRYVENTVLAALHTFKSLAGK